MGLRRITGTGATTGGTVGVGGTPGGQALAIGPTVVGTATAIWATDIPSGVSGKSIRIQKPVATDTWVSGFVATTAAPMAWQVYIKIASWSGGPIQLCPVRIPGQNGGLQLDSSRRLVVTNSSGTPLKTGTLPLTTGVWLRIDLFEDPATTTTGQFTATWSNEHDVAAQETLQPTAPGANLGTADPTEMRLGVNSTAGTCDIYLWGYATNDGASTVIAPAFTANVLPTAAFTTSISSLTVSVDGTTSSDSDGTVTGWAWDFGDGTTGTGSTTSHTYGAGGTYTISLVVTDNSGGASTPAVTHSVTVTSPATVPTSVGVSAPAGQVPTTNIWNLPLPAGSSANQLLIGFIGNERGTILPTLTAGSVGIVIPVQKTNANIAATFFWKRLTAADITYGKIQATFEANRGVIGALETIDYAGDPVYVPVDSASATVGDAGGAAPGTITSPNITPGSADNLIVSQATWVPVAASFTRTTTNVSGWTREFTEIRAGGGTGISPVATAARKLISGGSGTPVTGYAPVMSDVSTHAAYWAVSIAIPPAASVLPIARPGINVTGVEPFTLLQLDGSGSTGKGPMTAKWRRVLGPPVYGFVPNDTTLSPQVRVRGAVDASTDTFGLTVTDADGNDSDEALVTATILPNTEFLITDAGPVPTQIVTI